MPIPRRDRQDAYPTLQVRTLPEPGLPITWDLA